MEKDRTRAAPRTDDPVHARSKMITQYEHGRVWFFCSWRLLILLVGSLISGTSLFGQSTPAKPAQINCPSPDSEVTLHGSASPTLPILDILQCNELVTVSGQEGNWYKVKTQTGKEGYVKEAFIAFESVDSSNEESSVEKEIPPGTVLKQPTYMPVVANGTHHAAVSDAYSLSLRVLQTEQVPYSVQYGGGQISTSCTINGTTNSVGTALASGNVAFGNATSHTNLTMNCNSYQTPPAQWRHVLNAMLVVASNGNAYVMACDAAWRWSKCRGLIVGDTFRARMTDKGLAVEYFEGKGKPREATYAILQSKVLGN